MNEKEVCLDRLSETLGEIMEELQGWLNEQCDGCARKSEVKCEMCCNDAYMNGAVHVCELMDAAITYERSL